MTIEKCCASAHTHAYNHISVSAGARSTIIYFYVGDFITPNEAVVTFTPTSPSINCYTVQSIEDTIFEELEIFPFSLFSDDPAVTAINPNGGQIVLLDDEG